MKKMFECVPNISINDKSLIGNVFLPIIKKMGCIAMDNSFDDDAKRAVITFIGTYDNIFNSCIKILEYSVKHISLKNHKGIHPRIGVVDVMPIIPILNTNMKEAIELSIKIASFAGNKLKIPVYLYRESAKLKQKYLLKNCRKGQYENIEQKLKDNNWTVDYGPNTKTNFGICNIGARELMIAYNVSISAKNIEQTRDISKKIRNLNTNKKKPFVTSIGWYLKKYNSYQISMNLNDLEQLSLYKAFESVKKFSEYEGIKTLGSQIIGMVPKSQFDIINNKTNDNPIEYLGLNYITKFNNSQIITFL